MLGFKQLRQTKAIMPKSSESHPSDLWRWEAHPVLSDALDMLEAVYKSRNLNRKTHGCHFCGKQASQDEHGIYWEAHEHDCLYLKIETYLKEVGRL